MFSVIAVGVWVAGKLSSFTTLPMRRSLTKQRRRVSLLIETSSAYGRGLLRGIARWMREHDAWTASLGEYRSGQLVPEELSRGECDGVIARIESPSLARFLGELRLPIVDVSRFRLLADVPFVDADDEAIARLAFEHFSERGFRHVGFVGDDNILWSQNRRVAFTRLAEQHGAHCHVFTSTPSRRVHYNLPAVALARWIAKLPKPAGLFCAWDGFARQVLQACRAANVHVADEVAVLGVGNDELEGGFSQPPLSTIAPDAEGAGHAAAALLHERMTHPRRRVRDVVLSPRGLIARQSTEVLALDDARLTAAVRMIRERACAGLRVADLERAIPLSRRELEARFRQHFGRSPHQEILRVRLLRAKALLTETKLTLADIAERCGFEHPEYFNVVFKRHEQMTPRNWRLQNS